VVSVLDIEPKCGFKPGRERWILRAIIRCTISFGGEVKPSFDVTDELTTSIIRAMR
jgi:hypothetical protein